MPRKRLAPLTVKELRYLLKKDEGLRKDLKRLRLKLTPSGRLAAPKREGCAPIDFRPEHDPLILNRRPPKQTRF